MTTNDALPQSRPSALPSWLRPFRCTSSSLQEDFEQDAVVNVLSRVQRAPDTPLTAAYFRRALRNAAVGDIRRRRRREHLHRCNAPVLARGSRHGDDPERRLASEEIGREIRSAFAVLSDARREAVVLHLRGYPLREVARILSVDRKRADNLVHRGLASLRSTLRARGVTVHSSSSSP